MTTTIEIWSIKKLYGLRDKINPKPFFQRGPAWGEKQRYLLIDSILRGYDIPKIYLNVLTPGRYVHPFTHEVADGQQRLRAIYDFIEDKFPLGTAAAGINTGNLPGKTFSQLDSSYRQHINDYSVTVTLLRDATKEELQSLFARLQMGVVLNPPELRNALCSVIGSVIEIAAMTHPFFDNAGIPDKRFKRQDYLCHALALATYNNEEDLKAPLLKRFYEDGLTKYNDTLVTRCYQILDWMNGLAPEARKLLRKKWCFVDIFDLFRRHHNRIENQSETMRLIDFGSAYALFEHERHANTKKPENLLAHPADRKLYDYTVAFKTTPATKQNIACRREALEHYFANHLC